MNQQINPANLPSTSDKVVYERLLTLVGLKKGDYLSEALAYIDEWEKLNLAKPPVVGYRCKSLRRERQLIELGMTSPPWTLISSVSETYKNDPDLVIEPLGVLGK